MIHKIHQNLSKILIIFIIFFCSSCGLYKKTDVNENPINDAEKRAKNIKEGRGITFGGGKKSGEFDFASSNEMWRATFEVLDFVPLLTADYSGGVIITDWYSDDLNSKESLKIMVKFLSNEIRADGLDIKIYKKYCDDKQNCNTQLINSNLNREINLAILKKAAQIKLSDTKKKTE